MRRTHELPIELSAAKVLEQFFFSHEGFSYQRHLIFTTVILFASMFSASIVHVSTRYFGSPPFSLVGHL